MTPLPPPRHGRTPYNVPGTSAGVSSSVSYKTNRKRKHATEGIASVETNKSNDSSNKKGKQS